MNLNLNVARSSSLEEKARVIRRRSE